MFPWSCLTAPVITVNFSLTNRVFSILRHFKHNKSTDMNVELQCLQFNQWNIKHKITINNILIALFSVNLVFCDIIITILCIKYLIILKCVCFFETSQEEILLSLACDRVILQIYTKKAWEILFWHVRDTLMSVMRVLQFCFKIKSGYLHVWHGNWYHF